MKLSKFHQIQTDQQYQFPVDSYKFILLFEAIHQVLLIREGINKVTKHLLQQFKGIIAV